MWYTVVIPILNDVIQSDSESVWWNVHGFELLVVVNHFCHVKNSKVLQPGKFWAAQKVVLYLERGPGRYVLAWSVSRAFSTIDGEETLDKNAQMSNTGSREGLHIQPWLVEIKGRLQTVLTAAWLCMKSHALTSYATLQTASSCPTGNMLGLHLNTQQLPSPPPCLHFQQQMVSSHLWLSLHLLKWVIPPSWKWASSYLSLLQLLVADWSSDELWQVFNVDTRG